MFSDIDKVDVLFRSSGPRRISLLTAGHPGLLFQFVKNKVNFVVVVVETQINSPVLRKRMFVTFKLKKRCFLLENTAPWLKQKTANRCIVIMI